MPFKTCLFSLGLFAFTVVQAHAARPSLRSCATLVYASQVYVSAPIEDAPAPLETLKSLIDIARAAQSEGLLSLRFSFEAVDTNGSVVRDLGRAPRLPTEAMTEVRNFDVKSLLTQLKPSLKHQADYARLIDAQLAQALAIDEIFTHFKGAFLELTLRSLPSLLHLPLVSELPRTRGDVLTWSIGILPTNQTLDAMPKRGYQTGPYRDGTFDFVRYEPSVVIQLSCRAESYVDVTAQLPPRHVKELLRSAEAVVRGTPVHFTGVRMNARPSGFTRDEQVVPLLLVKVNARGVLQSFASAIQAARAMQISHQRPR